MGFFSRICKTLGRELGKTWILLSVSIYFVIMDETKSVVVWALSVTTMVIFLGHLTRRVLTPYVSFKALYVKSLESPMSAAIVLMSFIFLIISVIHATVSLLTR